MKIKTVSIILLCILSFPVTIWTFPSKGGLPQSHMVIYDTIIQNEQHLKYPLKFVDSFEDGTGYLSPNGIYPVLNLFGDWRSMGRQYGYLLQHQLRKFHDEISADVMARGIAYQDQVEFATLVSMVYGSEIHQLMDGIADTSGLSRQEVLVLNAGMMLLTGAVLADDPPAACSGIAAWGENTSDDMLVFGRNWDINREAMTHYMKYLGVVVFHPLNGLALANIHPVGNLYLETGMNETGLFLELNNGEQSNNGYDPGAEDTASVLLRVLASSRTINEAFIMLKKTPADLSYIIQLADPYRSVSMERATFGCRLREGKYPGLLATYNSFVPPYPQEWEALINPPPPVSQDPRLANLRNLGNSPEYKGRFNLDNLKKLMDISVKDGGAVHGGTVYQVIAIPETKAIWLRGLDYSDWEKVALSSLF
ncbi:C45 family autoproteolytic acyltransferase/hydolase [Desulfotignum phosphitoxidans]|jgi:predicted choloylglycine hydrolase|uniref:Uncharacterized protein n=1 Tax=Desulfotignum phosphitoxidans DSM 13687 TaxID=1286635 RepID=S0FR34_9BACT|nr:C45 family peptidase [Desulfotignum phosphitoxidans]EMS77553.1 hypothetical protein Dpo_14c00370 [Desulfotignum phosphitoxidans DSM 13687]